MADLTKKGCLKNIIIFLAVLVSIIFISSILIYRQFDGKEGIKGWIVKKAIDSTQKLTLRQRPDGVSQKDIEQTFEQLKSASKNNQVHLIKLYHILERYQQDFRGSSPSNEEMSKFLDDLRSTIKEH